MNRELVGRAAGWFGVVLGLGLPVFLTINYVARFAVDVPYWDQWELVQTFDQWKSGELTLARAFAMHNEHRIFFPRLVFVALAELSRWDTRWEIWFNWAVLLGLGILLLAEHLSHFGRSQLSAALFIPAAWMIFTLRQDTNLLWGFQIQITLCAITACAALWLLSQAERSPWWLAGAYATAVVCSFSFASGLMVWPAGLVLLAWRLLALRDPTRTGRRLVGAAAWAVAGALAAWVYFHDYSRSGGGPPTVSLVLAEPGKALYYFLVAFGGALAVEADPQACAGMGAVLVAICVLLAFVAWRDQVDREKAALGLALIAFSAATVATITVGRLAYAAGASSRYTTLTLLGVVGVYRCALAVRPELWRGLLTGATTALIAAGLFVTLDSEFVIGTRTRHEREQMREVLLDWKNRPDGELQLLYPVADEVRRRAAVLERLRLSVFRGAGVPGAAP